MPELDILQERTLELFSKSPLKDKFYWTGGTLLSFLYLHHRKSEDLDFFSERVFSYNQIIGFIQTLKKQLKLTKIEEKRIFDRWEFIIHNKGNLRLEFVLYEFPRLKPRKKWKSISVDSLEDIAVNKTMALFDRAESKDLVDLYFLLTQKNYEIKGLLKGVEKKFGVQIKESSLLAQSLLASKNLDKIRPLLLAKNSKEKQKIIDDIKEYFSSCSSDYLNKVLE